MDRAPKHVATVTLHPRAGDGALAARLRREIRGEVLFDAASRGRYSTDASIYQIEPVGVVVPQTEEDARIAIQIAADQGVPILPRGGGTSQCGQTVGAALVIDNSKYLNQVVAFDKDARTAVVQPGMVLDQLNAYLKPHGLWFPVDVSTSAQATLGGMAGNNSCGSRSIRYGNMVHNVLGIDALLADGSEFHFGASDQLAGAPRAYRALVERVHAIVRREAAEIEARWPKVLRRVQGYNIDMVQPGAEGAMLAHNLAHLLVGSEGTLAYSRRIHLALAPLPQHKTLGVCHFPAFHQSMQAPQHIVKLGPTAVELVDRTMIELARGNAAFKPIVNRFLKGDPDAILLVEFAGDDRGEQLAKLKQLVELMAELGFPGGVVEITDAALQKEVWEVRKAGLNIMMSMKGEGKPVSFIEDCAVPLEHLAEYTDKLTQVFARHGTRGTWYAHASVGTLHVRPVLNMKEGGAKQMRAIAEEACELVKRYKGAAYSGEHGDGLARSEWIEPIIGARLMRALEEIKDLFDPRGLMNPGKIVRGSKQDDRSLFRFKPGYAAQQLDTALDWSEWNAPGAAGPGAAAGRGPETSAASSRGFVAAVEMCNNNGHCRKFDAGTMCPSYRATGNERDLTRGRANTLRLALSGQLGADAFTSEAMHEAMDLCVSCKGCKRECPTGVDMAKMKIEFLHHYHKRHGLLAQGPVDRLSAALRALGRAPALARQPARHPSRPGCPERIAVGPVRQALLAQVARRSVPVQHPRAGQEGGRGATRGRASGRHLQQLFRTRQRARRAGGARGGGLSRAPGARGRRPKRKCAPAVLRPHFPRQRPGGRGKGRGAAHPRSASALRRARPAHHRAGAFVSLHPARRIQVHAARREHRSARRTGGVVRRIPRRRAPGRQIEAQAQAPAAEKGPAARPLPPESLRRDATGGAGARPGSGTESGDRGI